MKNYIEAIEHSYFVAFNKYDNDLIIALETAENILARYINKLTSEQLCKVYLTIAICKTKMDLPDDVMPMLLEVEQIAITNGYVKTLSSCLNLQANRLSRAGRLQEAIQKLLNLMEIVSTPESKITVLNNLGVVYTSYGMFDKSLECLFETLRMCEKIDSSRDYMRTCINVANCYYEQHNYEKSIEYFTAAQKISIDYPQDDSLISLAANLGLAYANLLDFQKAMELMDQAQELEKKLSFVKNKGSLVYNIGYVHEKRGNREEALKYYTEALEIVRTSGDILLLSTILNSKASLHTKKGEYKVAEKLLQESLSIATESNLSTQKLSCLKQLAFLYRSNHKHKRAFEYLQEYHKIHELAFIDKVKNGIIKYESDYLTEKIEQKAELYRLQYVELVEKNTIISQKQKELEEALAQLSESNATKNKLFSIIAHDLRGPVANLQMTIEAILLNAFSEQDQNLMLNLLHDETKNTYDLLENLLWWAQSQKEGLTLHPATIKLSPIIQHIRAVYLTNAQKKNVTIEVKTDDSISVFADKDALALVLRNLIGNAIKYSPLNGTVTVSAINKGSRIVIDVADQGSGINPQIITSVRKKKHIKSLPGTASEKGMGLGLSLCYEFAHKMEGKINICKEVKAGTCFCLELPAT